MRGSMRSGRRVKFSDRAVSFAWKQRIGGILSTVLAIRCLSGRVFTLSFPAPKRSEALNLKPGDHILDIGPGWGAWLERSRRSAAICVFRAKWFGRSSDRRRQGYEGGYDAVRRYARAWSKGRASETASAYVPLSFAPGEAYQFDWSHDIVVMDGVTTTVKVAQVRNRASEDRGRYLTDL